MTALLDPIPALIAYLKTDSDLQALAGTRIFGGELPDAENASMPRSSVVLRHAGSPNVYGTAYQEFGDTRIEIRTYGATVYKGTELARIVAGRLKNMRRNVQAGTILHWATSSGGMMQLRDPDAEWPFTLTTWQVLAAERA